MTLETESPGGHSIKEVEQKIMEVLRQAEFFNPCRSAYAGKRAAPVLNGAVPNTNRLENKMKKYMLIMGLIAVTAMLGAAAPADKEQLQPQTNCPVMGGKIDKKVYADYDGKRIYFCCAGCLPQFKKDPGTYLKKLQAEGIAPESIPAAAGTEKKEMPKAEHKDAGGCH